MNIHHMARRVWRQPLSGRGRESGMVLLVAVIVLALMLLAGLGVMRAADTGNVVAGNFSFQQAATQSSDRVVTDALNFLSGKVPAGGGNTAIANRYLNVRAATVDARGIPTSINWEGGGVSCVDPNGVAIGDCTVDAGNYRIQYVVERMCTENPNLADITDIRAKCEFEHALDAAAAAATTAAGISVRYRVLIRVRGPRGTDAYYEVMVSGPASK